jgi:hypothetical protein
LRHNGKNDIYSHAETSGARRGAFFRFSRPTLRRFSHLFVSNQFWRTAGAFSKTTIFFKLQAGVSLVSSVPPPRLHRTTPRLRPTPAAPEFDHLKSLYCSPHCGLFLTPRARHRCEVSQGRARPRARGRGRTRRGRRRRPRQALLSLVPWLAPRESGGDAILARPRQR